MKLPPSPLVLNHCPHTGDAHPQTPEWRAVNIRTSITADIEGRIVYLGPKKARKAEAFVLRLLPPANHWHAASSWRKTNNA